MSEDTVFHAHFEANADPVPIETLRLIKSIMESREASLIEKQLAQICLSQAETICKLIVALETGSLTLTAKRSNNFRRS